MGIETLAAISIGTAVAGAGIGAYGAYQSGQSSKASYTYQAQVAKNNIEIAKRNADYARAAGESEAQIVGMKSRQQLGQTKASQASKGLDVNSGSNLAVRESMADVDSFEQMMIRSNAARSAYSSEVEAINQENQRNVDIMAGKQASKAGTINTFSSLVGGASSVSDKWLKFSTAGVWA